MLLSVDQFKEALIASGVLDTAEIDRFWNSLPIDRHPQNAGSFAKLLLDNEHLTKFQADELLSNGRTPLVLGDYELLSRIGVGGMGQVFKAKHRHMDRFVAIKLLSEGLTKDASAVQRFQREVKTAAKLVHPNIVQAYDASVQRGAWYLVMEYVEGLNLAELIASRGTQTVEQAIDLIQQAAKGLAFAHSKGVVHRDIKPANLLLGSDGTLKILDMGLARIEGNSAIDGLTQVGQVMGTIDYMAPEQALDIRSADARADIYSLGCTLYRLLTGQNMYDGAMPVQKLMAHQNSPIPPLHQLRPDIPGRLASIFENMVAKKPQHRFQTMEEVDRALAGLIEKPSSFLHPVIKQSKAEPTPVDMFASTVKMQRPPSQAAARSLLRERSLLLVVMFCLFSLLAAAIMTRDIQPSSSHSSLSNRSHELLTNTTRTEGHPKPRKFELQFAKGDTIIPPYTLHLDTSQPFTLECFITLANDVTEGVATVIANTGRAHLEILPNNCLSFAFYHVDGHGTSGVGEVPLEKRRRIHLAVVRTQIEIILFVDGKEIARWEDREKPRSFGSDVWSFGGGQIGGLEGIIGEVRISQTARYLDNFKPQLRHDTDEKTLALYHCDEGDSETAPDSSGNRYDAKLVGAKWAQVEAIGP